MSTRCLHIVRLVGALGWRWHQERHWRGGTAEVVARLKEVTVDPKTVTLAKVAPK